MNMHVFKSIRPYRNDGNCNLSFGRKKPGVYIISVDGIVMYIGYSATNVYKTCIRHFQRWEDKRQYRATYNRNTALVRLIITNTSLQADRLEKALINKYQPIDNLTKYKSFVKTKSREKWIAEFEKENEAKPVNYDEIDLPF